MPENYAHTIMQLLRDQGPLTTKQLQEKLNNKLEKETINALLFGQLRELVIRDKDENGFPFWRAKERAFEAARGLEVSFHKLLIQQKICTQENVYLDYQLRNRRNNKTYHLDIAIFQHEKKYNIEIDGFEHIRADARASIQKQLEENPKNTEIDIDWMDNKNSFVDFRHIDSAKIFKWCITQQDWCMRYHEELLKPHDITRNIWLIDSGWKVIRFWNFEIKTNPKRCLQQVQHWIERP